MAHNHGNEYQIRIVRADGAEEFSGWMDSTNQVAQAMLALRRPEGKAYWLMVRNVLCSNCPGIERIVEYPMMNVPSTRYIPHDSRYLRVVESRSRWAVHVSAPGPTP